jgi:hypothetical protein
MRRKAQSGSAVALKSSSRPRLVCGQKTFYVNKKIQFHRMFCSKPRKFLKNVRHFPAKCRLYLTERHLFYKTAAEWKVRCSIQSDRTWEQFGWQEWVKECEEILEGKAVCLHRSIWQQNSGGRILPTAIDKWASHVIQHELRIANFLWRKLWSFLYDLL